MAEERVDPTMSEEINSVKPNPYIFDIENRRKRKPRLAHDLGAGAKCNKCGDKCPGFELHFWRKICMNCRCGKDDHDVEDDEEDIGKVVIGKLFDRPARTKKEELEFSYGNHLDMVNEETGKPEKVKFDWVPPNIEKNLAARYMALLPPEKRPVAGSEAAKERRKQLEQQLPLYDMDASQRCENMPAEELQSFQAYLERIKTQVAGQGIVQEIVGVPVRSTALPLNSQPRAMKPPLSQEELSSNAGNAFDQTHSTSSGLPFEENYNAYAIPAPYKNSGKSNNQQDKQAHPHGEIRSNLREFMGEMIGVSGRSVASSEPYGVVPGTCQPLRGIGQDERVQGVAAGLSGLHLSGNQHDSSTGQQASDPQSKEGALHHHYATPPGGKSPQNILPHQGTYVTREADQLPYLGGSVKDKQGLAPNQDLVSSRQGLVPNQEGFFPGKQSPVPDQEGFVPGKQGLVPNQEGFVPGKQSLAPNKEGFASGRQGLVPSQEGFVPGKQGPVSDQEGFVLGKQGLVPNQEGFVPGRQGLVPNQEGFAPGKQGLLPNVDSHLQVPSAPAVQNQALTPGRDITLHHYQTEGSEHVNLPAYQKAGVPDSHTTSKDPSAVTSDQWGGRGLPHNTPAREENVVISEAHQAPYSAYKETLAGGMQLAPGSDVTVLFPGESQVLGSKAISGDVPGQKSKFSCQSCKLPMNIGDVAIFCERAGKDKCWHPACFSCDTCKELLADLIYFYKDGKVYCGRHFTEAVDMSRCKACDELIFGNSWTRADDFDWHLHHYCCNVCDTALAGQRYVPDKDGFPYCLPCYMAYLAKMCQTCEEKIAPDENRCSHRGYFYHANSQCFQCYTCKTPLLGRKFKMSKNWLFCSNECIQAAAHDLANNPNPKEMPQ